jgi:AcrR family transcriptional regulator
MTQTTDASTGNATNPQVNVSDEPAVDPAPDNDADAHGDALPPKFAQATKAKRDALHHDAASTRERILDVALDLFSDKGYDATSLREIAERLGVTKAALYYHFASKEDILMALHMRLHEFGKEAMANLGDEPVSLERWAEILDGLVDQMMAQRKLFLLHERNQATFEKVHREGHDAEHEDLQNRFRQILGDPRVTLRDRVRMAASFGVIFSGLVLASEAFTEAKDAEMLEELRQCVHNVLLG